MEEKKTNTTDIEIEGILEEASQQTDETPEALYAQLIQTIRSYRPNTDLTMIEQAYQLADEAHKEQKRKSGEPYIIHPLHTAIILAELELDKESIVAGLLHDVIEDTEYTKEQISQLFGEDVAGLVDGVTKLTRLNYKKDKLEEQAENLRKMFLAMARDIRVILIKLADRLHNLRTLQYQTPEKQKEKARETMDIYCPIASRLGISKIKIELDDLSLKYLEPEKYEELVHDVKERVTYKEGFILDLVDEVKGVITKANIEADINGRIKHLFSIYKKMVNQQKTLDQIYDIFAVRIIVENVRDCYAALGAIHEKYTPIPGRFKDYIAMPKPNMYQSLHTTLIGPSGQPFEIQIRTYEMHRTAEYGIAAHWKYKESGGSNEKVDTAKKEEEKLTWLREVLEWQRDMSDNREFMSLLKSDLDLFSEQVYAFTPNGDVKNLPNGSTPIDFAYSIHSAVGNKMVGARVNGKMVPIDYKIQNGDRIEIVTSQNSKGPSRDWLNVVKSAQAKNKINQWFKHELKEDNIVKGKELIAQYCKAHNVVLSNLMKPEYTDRVVAKYGFRELDALIASVGRGGLKEGQVINKLLELYEKDHQQPVTDEQVLAAIGDADVKGKNVHVHKSKTGIIVKGMADMSVRLSKCCAPVPGDEIVGFVTRGRGVTIHRTDCVNVINLPDFERRRLIEAEWQQDPNEEKKDTYLAEINIYANNRTGILADLSHILSERNIDVRSINSRTSKQGIATITISFEITSVSALNKVIDKMRQVESIISIERTRG
jgi:GTP pyrophosphokinase